MTNRGAQERQTRAIATSRKQRDATAVYRVMAGRTNYRVKLDLSKYYQDARRFSWIYVNSRNVWFVSHLERHIRAIFDIEGPFHLLLNGNEYLPPAEDVRVLEENEVIVVERGSARGEGGTDGAGSRASPAASNTENGLVESTPATDKTDRYARERKPLDGDEIYNGVADATAYRSIAEASGAESGSERKRNNDESLDSSILRGNVTPPRKRKRVRRRKTKETERAPAAGGSGARREATTLEKPKVVGSYALPSGTHIRFDNPEDDDGERKKVEDGRSVNRGPSSERPRVEGLSRLLALGNCSSPLAFPNKRVKYENGSAEPGSENKDAAESHDSPKNGSSIATGGGPGDPPNGRESDEYADLRPQEFPSLESSTEVGDVIAFKVLRIGSEYTPEVSDYIVAETLARCPENTSYTLKILKGRSEMEGPSGKFSLPESEAPIAESSDTAEFHFSQLIEPRLIARTRVSR